MRYPSLSVIIIKKKKIVKKRTSLIKNGILQKMEVKNQMQFKRNEDINNLYSTYTLATDFN